MIKNYFRIAFRNLTRNKFAGAINIGGLAIGITILTVSFQAVRAAIANPVDSLRTE